MKGNTLRIGTRGSQLARVQANIVEKTLRETFPQYEVEISIINTSGDLDLKSPLYEIGGKGVFIKELEVALLNNKIDLAVHSLKDVTAVLAKGLQLTAFIKPEAISDSLISSNYSNFNSLPPNAVIATGSLRRKAILKKIRPDIKTVDIRGNVETRIKKQREEGYDGVILSTGGLLRLGLAHLITEEFDPLIFYPAPGQGVMTIETRIDDERTNEICRALSNQEQETISRAQLTFLQEVGFDCKAPLGIHTIIEGTHLHSKIFLADTSMQSFLEKEISCSEDNYPAKMRELGQQCLTWYKKVSP